MDGWMDFNLPHLGSSLRIPLWSLVWSLDLWGPFAGHRALSSGPGPAAPPTGAPGRSAGLRRQRHGWECLPRGRMGNTHGFHLLSETSYSIRWDPMQLGGTEAGLQAEGCEPETPGGRVCSSARCRSRRSSVRCQRFSASGFLHSQSWGIQGNSWDQVWS